MINDLPTIFDVVSGKSKTKAPSNNNHSNSKSKSSNKMQKTSEPRAKQPKPQPKEEDREDEAPDAGQDGGAIAGGGDEHGETLCGACGDNYGTDEFWIGCDMCERWFHGKCVKITPAKAEHIKQYKCPSCTGTNGSGSNKRARLSS